MRNKLFRLTAAAAALCCVAGCRQTRLAPRDLTAEEATWAECIKRSYSTWRPPYLSPVRLLEGSDADRDASAPSAPAPAAARPAAPLLTPAPTEEIVLIPVDGAKPVKPQREESYTVRQGDSLHSIAKKFHGRTDGWRRIYDRNRDILTAPDRLKPGMVLRIPMSGSSD